jgi:predicted small secreted protein
MKRSILIIASLILPTLAGCNPGVSEADINHAIQLCEGHHGLQEVRSISENSIDVYCNSGAQFNAIEKIRNDSK